MWDRPERTKFSVYITDVITVPRGEMDGHSAGRDKTQNLCSNCPEILGASEEAEGAGGEACVCMGVCVWF